MLKILFLAGLAAGLIFWAPSQGGTVGAVGTAARHAALKASASLSPLAQKAKASIMTVVREQAHKAVEQGLK